MMLADLIPIVEAHTRYALSENAALWTLGIIFTVCICGIICLRIWRR